MRRMGATAIRIRSRESLDRIERLARARVKRDGVAPLEVPTAARRHVRHLGRLAGRLAASGDLPYIYGERGDGTTALIVLARLDRPIAWRGEAKTG
jgi:hypothetical protein